MARIPETEIERLKKGSSHRAVGAGVRRGEAAGAANEETMGWTRAKRDKLARVVDVETFSGAALLAVGCQRKFGRVTTS